MRCWFAVVAVMMLVTASCGGGGSDAAGNGDQPEESAAPGSNDGGSSLSSALSDPCSLISDQEMGDLLSNPVASSMLSAGLCEYSPVDINVGRVGAEVFVQDVAATGCDLYFSVGGFKNAEPFDGIGTTARWKAGSSVNQLGVCLDEKVTLTITLYDPGHYLDGQTAARSAARSAGELVISRL